MRKFKTLNDALLFQIGWIFCVFYGFPELIQGIRKTFESELPTNVLLHKFIRFVIKYNLILLII